MRQKHNRIGLLGICFVLFVSRSFGQAPSRQTGLGEVRGKVTITSVTQTVEDTRQQVLFDRYSAHRMHMSVDQRVSAKSPSYKLSEKAVVFLEGEELKGQIFLPPIQHPILDQKDLTFHPQVLPILMGTIVNFPNQDNLFHNVFSYSQPKEFDLGRYPTGESRAVRFDRPGVVRVYCDIHAHMNATILILENPFFAAPDEDGNYTIKNVPVGNYTVKFWYGRDVVETRTIEVKKNETIVVNLSH